MFPRWAKFVFFAVLAIAFGHRAIVEILVDWLWFDALSHSELFQTKFQTQLVIWTLFFVGTVAFMFLNLRYSLRVKSIPLRRLQEQFVDAPVKSLN